VGQRLASSMERRLRDHRHELVADLFTRHGLFWEQVRWIRERTRVEAEVRMPPLLNPDTVHYPGWIRAALKAWSREPGLMQDLREWMALLHVLHEAVVPNDLRVETPYSNSLDFWMGFLSACIIYDPPLEDLLGFAEHGVAAYGDFVNPLNPWEDGDGPEMLAPPIRFLPDPERVIADERQRHDWVLGKLQEAIDRRPAEWRGEVDLAEMAASFEFVYESVQDEERRERFELPRLPMQPYIEVGEHTTEADVRNAYRLMAAHRPAGPRATRPLRDELLCLQCAVWYDECGWSHAQIADKFGWAVQPVPGAKPRSETARKYIAKGRTLLGQRKAAA
jgi:hypothetical protein